MEKTFTKGFKSPDETRKFKAHGQMDVLKFGDAATWSNDVKPIAGTPSCQAVHTGYCISGSMTVKMDSGEQFTVRPGDGFHMPPGHDAWTEGKEACVLIDVTGVKNYAKPK
jgi:hypothetical protein